MKKMFPFVFFIILLVSFLSPNKVQACSCFEPIVKEKLERSSVVFTGTVVSRDTEGGNVFSVDKVWKGELKDGYVFSGFNGMCGTDFVEGNKYLIYTENVKGQETTSICSGNKLIADEDATKEMKALDGMTEPQWKNNYVLYIVLGFALILSIVFFRTRLRGK